MTEIQPNRNRQKSWTSVSHKNAKKSDKDVKNPNGIQQSERDLKIREGCGKPERNIWNLHVDLKVNLEVQMIRTLCWTARWLYVIEILVYSLWGLRVYTLVALIKHISFLFSLQSESRFAGSWGNTRMNLFSSDKNNPVTHIQQGCALETHPTRMTVKFISSLLDEQKMLFPRWFPRDSPASWINEIPRIRFSLTHSTSDLNQDVYISWSHWSNTHLSFSVCRLKLTLLI